MDDQKPLLKVEGLAKHFAVGKGKTLKAVDGVSFAIKKGETFGLVGESGCGKSTLGRTVIGLYEPSAGSVEFDGVDLAKRLTRKQRDALSLRMQMIFQDPYTSLNPRRKVADIIAEGIDNHRLARSKAERNRMVVDLLHSVGLEEEHGGRYPHEFSGGQRQRIALARALAPRPSILLADEPVSALDVSVRAQVLNLINGLVNQMGLTLVMVSHDLAVVRHTCDHVGVLYHGALVEAGPTDQVLESPTQAYTRELLAAAIRL